MNPTLRNILALVAGIVVGMIINSGIVMLSGAVVPLPEGINPNDMESLKANAHLMEAKHFVMPFLAHAMGTLTGAMVAAAIAATRKMTFALVVGVFFLIGGIVAATMIPAPTWFIVLDLVVAYLPMAWLGGRLVTGRSNPAA